MPEPTKDADGAVATTLQQVLNEGEFVGGADDPAGQRELLGFQVAIANPLARITTNPSRPLNIVSAIARFTWMIAGNDRLADIQFYEPKVASYTDDGLTVPGSSYGRRIVQPRPGLNQLAGAVARLRDKRDSRRAATVIWTPEDAVRESNDIPCAFGTFYHVREAGLVATTVMRSNNAFLLLPFNIFEFSLLAEVVAAEIGLPIINYQHWSASMHVYNRDQEKAAAFVAAPATSDAMPAMPTDPSPLEQTRLLAVAEADLRLTASSGDVEALRSRVADELHPYWLALFDVLAVKRLSVINALEAAHRLKTEVPDYFARHIPAMASPAVTSTLVDDQLALFESDSRPADPVAAALANDEDWERALVQLVNEIEAGGESVSHEEFARLQRRLRSADFGLVARSSTSNQGAASDRSVSLAEVRRALAYIRSTARP